MHKHRPGKFREEASMPEQFSQAARTSPRRRTADAKLVARRDGCVEHLPARLENHGNDSSKAEAERGADDHDRDRDGCPLKAPHADLVDRLVVRLGIDEALYSAVVVVDPPAPRERWYNRLLRVIVRRVVGE